MKKVIGILSFIAIAAVLFLNTNNSVGNWDVSLDLISAANATNPECGNDIGDSCAVYGTTIWNCDEADINDCQE